MSYFFIGTCVNIFDTKVSSSINQQVGQIFFCWDLVIENRKTQNDKSKVCTYMHAHTHIYLWNYFYMSATYISEIEFWKSDLDLGMGRLKTKIS
jgi:hypothetical protein